MTPTVRPSCGMRVRHSASVRPAAKARRARAPCSRRSASAFARALVTRTGVSTSSEVCVVMRVNLATGSRRRFTCSGHFAGGSEYGLFGPWKEGEVGGGEGGSLFSGPPSRSRRSASGLGLFASRGGLFHGTSAGEDICHAVVPLVARILVERQIRAPQRDCRGPWLGPRL